MLCKQVHLVEHLFHGSPTRPVSQITALCQRGGWLLPAGASEMPIVITAFILKYSPDPIPNERHRATDHVSLAGAKHLAQSHTAPCAHICKGPLTFTVTLHSAALQPPHLGWERECRNGSASQTAHEEIGYFQSIDCLSSASISSDRECASTANHGPSRGYSC